MEKNKKRRNHFRYNQNVKQKWVESGCCGLFFTCNGNERQAVREAYNVIEQTLELWKKDHSLEDSDDDVIGIGTNLDSDQEDVADSVKRFCDQGFSFYYFTQILRFYCFIQFFLFYTKWYTYLFFIPYIC